MGITEIDNMLSELLLTPKQLRRADPYLQGMSHAGMTWLTTRAAAVVSSAILWFIVVFANDIILFLEVGGRTMCGQIQDVGQSVLRNGPGLMWIAPRWLVSTIVSLVRCARSGCICSTGSVDAARLQEDISTVMYGDVMYFIS